jgi:predicted dehydrogenase
MLMATMPYRMLQTGLGDFGRRWLRIVNAHSSWQYAALATRNERVRRDCADASGLSAEQLFASLEGLLGSAIQADALLVTTPAFRHREDVIMGLEHGLHVLVEKPLASSWSACLAIRDAASSASGVLMIGENYRFGEGARLAREIVASGELGKPEFLSMHYFVGHNFPAGDWRNDYRYPLLVENATHQFDLVRYITGTDAEEVYCSAFPSARTPHWERPNVSAQFAMTNEFHFQFAGSWSYDELRTPWEGVWRLYGSEGALHWTQDQLEVHRGGKVRTVQVPSRESDHTLAATFEEFTAALDEQRPATTAIADNMQTVAMVFGAMLSSEEHGPVSIPSMLAETSNGGGHQQPRT